MVIGASLKAPYALSTPKISPDDVCIVKGDPPQHFLPCSCFLICFLNCKVSSSAPGLLKEELEKLVPLVEEMKQPKA